MADTGKLVTPENTLKKKVGSGGFDEGDLVRAQHSIDNNRIDFRPLGLELLNELTKALEEVRTGSFVSKPDEEKFGILMYPLMQLKSQGGLFQYPLVTSISHITLDFLEDLEKADEDVFAIVSAYQKSVHAMLSMEIKTETHPLGGKFLSEMEAVFTRYKKSRAIEG